MVLAPLIVFITPINNQLLWFFTSLNATEVTASSTLHLQLSPSPAYALITIHYYISIQNPMEKSDGAWISIFKLTKNHKDNFFFLNVATSVA